MEFNAKQMREDALIKKGDYKFRISQGREKTSAAGFNMIVLKLMITVNSRDIPIYCTLLFMPRMFWLVEHFCQATGMSEKIEEGRLLAQDCDGKEGYLKINHRVSKETGELEAYVQDFIKREDLQPELKEDLSNFDDEIPSFT